MASAKNDQQIETEELDANGARLGLAIVAGLGFFLGATTCAGLWMLFPPARGHQWPLPTLALASVALLAVGYVVIGRRIGRVVADWFALGYTLALVAFGALVVGDQVVAFFRERIEAVLSV